MKSREILSENKNSVWLASRYIMLLVSSLLIYKINIDQYGSGIIGAWFLVFSIWTFGNAIDLGMGTAIVKYTAEYVNSRNSVIKYFLTSSFYAFILLGSVLTLIIYFVGLLFILNSTNIFSKVDVRVFRYVFIILGLSFTVKYITVFFRSVLEGMNEFVVASKIEIISSLILLIFITINSLLGLSIRYLADIYLVQSFLILFTYIYIFLARYKLNVFNFINFRYSSLKTIFSYSLHIQAVNLLGGLIDPIIKFLFGGYLGLDSVTYYEVGKRFAGSVTGLFLTTFRTILPKASILTGLHEQRIFLEENAVRYIKFGVLFTIVIFGVLSVIIVLFIKTFYGHINYVYVYLLLSLTESLTIFGSTLYIFIMGIGKGRLLAMLQVMNIVLISSSLLICLILFKDTIGLIGYSLTVLIGDIVLLLYIRKKYSIRIKKFLLDVNIIKFAVFMALMSFVIGIIYYLDWNVYLTLSAFSVVSFIMIIREAKEFVLAVIKSKKVML
ncbi:MAG: oligosaccharide flippase family protein [Ignavibacteriaceae bacterium]|nr:oligosaccharide flippase family protein [Ignavibacteriaceae bacterium]